MNVTQKDAQESLELIEQTTSQMRKSVASSYTGSLLILWGSIWALSCVSAHLKPNWDGYIFSTFNLMGVLATVLICSRRQHRTPTRTVASQSIYMRVWLLWLCLGLFAVVWTLVLRPTNGLQFCVFCCTVPMFAYVVMGLWFESYFMLWLGLLVTGLTLLGYYLLPGYFYLWMAPMGGGTMLGTGLYIHLRWR